MKKYLMKNVVLCMAMMVLFVSFTACSDDDDDKVVEIKNKLSVVGAEYSISLSEVWYDYFDIEVVYTAPTGTDTLLLTEDWMFSMKIPYTAEPEKFVCNITARPKKNVPAIVPDSSYMFKESVETEVYGVLENGNRSDNYGNVGSRHGSKSIGAGVMEKYIKAEHHLLSFSYVPKKLAE